MNTDINWFPEWYSTQATTDEKLLFDKVNEFGEQFFGDMLFREGTSTYELLKFKSAPLGSDDFKDDMFSPPDQLDNFEYLWFHFKVEELDDCGGMFDEDNQTLTVTPATLEDEITILHELIHLHEFVINDLSMGFHDMVFWALYKDLREKIPGLDDIITDHANVVTGSNICAMGGTHNILFLLKSFDLDIRKGYPLGTVFAYGRTEIFKSYSYKGD